MPLFFTKEATASPENLPAAHAVITDKVDDHDPVHDLDPILLRFVREHLLNILSMDLH
jgi:hypothetical protein